MRYVNLYTFYLLASTLGYLLSCMSIPRNNIKKTDSSSSNVVPEIAVTGFCFRRRIIHVYARLVTMLHNEGKRYRPTLLNIDPIISPIVCAEKTKAMVFGDKDIKNKTII